MRRLFTPILRVCLGLVFLTVSLVLIAHTLGLIPDEHKLALEVRAKISEALAIQIAAATSRNNASSVTETITLVAERNREVLSIAVRRADGEIFAQTGNHLTYWQEPATGRSTPTHVMIPLRGSDHDWGRIEIAFRPLAIGASTLGLSNSMLAFISFLGIAGLSGYYFLLRRALRELDPSRVIPERVQAAFDTLADGVLILDDHGRIVLANSAFCDFVKVEATLLFATNASELPWTLCETDIRAGDCPWDTALRGKRTISGELMGIRSRSGGVRRLMVSATPIMDGRNAIRGVMATFHDLTELHDKNEQLNLSIDQLRESQAQIEQQNKQLLFFASCDPLTGCLNRRTFFAEYERKFQNARSQRQPISFLMLDIDHFKAINDKFGHAVGDKVLVDFSALLKSCCGDLDSVGRYGGEEFCIVRLAASDREIRAFAERIRQQVLTRSRDWMPNGDPVTVSIGIASLQGGTCGSEELVGRSDRALYAAKSSGRNRVVWWEEIPHGGVGQQSKAASIDQPKRQAGVA